MMPLDTPQTLALINDSVRALKGYNLVPRECGTKLNQNENPYDWEIGIKDEAARFFVERPWNRYPHFVPDDLKAAVARHAGVETGNVIVGNGSNEMLLVLMLSFAAKAKYVIINTPTFTVYRLLSDGMGANTVNVALTDDLRYDVDAIKKAVIDHPGSMLIICSPNNPTGSAISEDDFKSILDIHTGICVFDQAYIEFGGFNGIGLINTYPNLIIARTFSKAMAAAGLRLGYMIGAAEVIAEVSKIKLPYNINFFTEHAASLILNNASIAEKTVRVIVEERDKLYQYLKSLPLDNVYPSVANFLLIRIPRKQELFDHLFGDDILVRDVSAYPMLENCLRISVGTPEENEKLRGSLGRFFG